MPSGSSRSSRVVRGRHPNFDNHRNHHGKLCKLKVRIQTFKTSVVHMAFEKMRIQKSKTNVFQEPYPHFQSECFTRPSQKVRTHIFKNIFHKASQKVENFIIIPCQKMSISHSYKHTKNHNFTCISCARRAIAAEGYRELHFWCSLHHPPLERIRKCGRDFHCKSPVTIISGSDLANLCDYHKWLSLVKSLVTYNLCNVS